ncbi:MAG: hypothetical protein A2X80_13770 [Geobacteraceae bacterium GWB2_52_12]|nr:MAG: hypothetical protein A2X80_13770 [Geobacteraceae bacterium GWB2_52_12]
MKSTLPYETLEPVRKAVVLSFLGVALWYMTWRIGTFNREALIFSWVLYGAELYGLFTTLMHFFITWRLTIRIPPPPQQGLCVDVFIPTINESLSLVRKSLLAARNMDYPHVTWLLDDGRRPEMEALAQELGCRYLSRPDNRDAKAGNMNNALLHSKGSFVVIFDADHAPKRDFITKTLGYFRDPSVAFVQTPQDFYNLDSFQHHRKKGGATAWHEQSVFFRVIQRGKDYWNAAFFCGSCATIRRSALDAIGGFAVGTVTEDLHTSLKLHKRGYRSVYHAQSLAFGLAPSGVAPFLNQRIRWGQGAMQVWRKEGVFFCRGLTFPQRINYLASSITYFDGWQKGFFYLTPAIVLTTGVMPLVGFGSDFLIHFIPYFILTFWAFEEVNRGYGRSIVIEQFNMARFAAMAWSTLGIFKDNIKFSVTPKAMTQSAYASPYLIPQAFISIVNLLAITVGMALYHLYHHLPTSGFVANIIWAAVNSSLAISVMSFVTKHSRHRRNDYRFPIPLPATIDFGDGRKFHGTIDDISSSGFRIYTALPDGTTAGTNLTGVIHLPAETVKFEALVKSLIKGASGGEQYVKGIGCSFVCSASSELDKLDLFLYGSDLQWSLNNLREVILTPLDLVHTEAGQVSGAPVYAPANWSAMSLTHPESGERMLGLIAVSHDRSRPTNILAYAPLPEGISLQVSVHGRRGVASLTGSVGAGKQIDTPGSPLYSYQFIPIQAVQLGH